MRWKRSVRSVILVGVAGFVMAFVVGWVTTVMAQQQSIADRQAVQIAVNAQKIDDLQASETRFTLRMDDLDNKLGALSDRLSTIQGMGMGAMTLLTVLNVTGIALHMRNKKPAA